MQIHTTGPSTQLGKKVTDQKRDCKQSLSKTSKTIECTLYNLTTESDIEFK